jgi:ubiquitin-like protein Pup
MATFIRDPKRIRDLQRFGGDPAAGPSADPAPLYAMASTEQKQKSKGGGGGDDEGSSGEGGQKLAEKGEELKEEMDELLDEIDSVLEENAEEFVKNYVQRGGE